MKTKRILTFLLSLLMVLTMGMTAFAAGEGSITINGVLKGNSYSVYKIFDLESYDKDNDAYSYTITSTDNPFYDIVSNLEINKGTETAPQIVKVFKLIQKGTTDIWNVTLSKDVGSVPETDKTTPRKIANALMAAIKEYNTAHPTAPIEPTKKIEKLAADGEVKSADVTVTKDATDDTNTKYSITFGKLDLGYYLIDTSAGTMLGLTTTKPTATIKAKNDLPSVEKKVQTHSSGSWSDDNSKQIGETVTFRTSVRVEAGAKNYTIYDNMGTGLKFDSITKIYYGNSAPSQAVDIIYDSKATPAVDEIEGKVKITTENVTYKGTPMDFKLEFTDEFAEEVFTYENVAGKDHTIYIEYEAVVTKDAVIGTVGNPNETWLTYGDNDVEVAKDETTTYVFKFDIVKTDGSNKVLTGAEFELYKDEDCTEIVKLVKLAETGESGETVYRVADEDELATAITTIEAGHVEIRGLGAGFDRDGRGRAYYLKETKAPDGFNGLAAAQVFRITGKSDKETPDATITAGVYQSGGVRIENNKGTLLPETGGIGTTIFYIVGGVLLVGATVLLITRKRMNAMDESK